MNETKTPEGILVRKPPFEYPPDFAPHWNPAKPEWSQLANGASVILPYFEPCMIDAMRAAIPRITDPALLTAVKAWIGQESQHFRQHRRFMEDALSDQESSVSPADTFAAGCVRTRLAGA